MLGGDSTTKKIQQGQGRVTGLEGISFLFDVGQTGKASVRGHVSGDINGEMNDI